MKQIYVHPFLLSINEQIRVAKKYKVGLELSLGIDNLLKLESSDTANSIEQALKTLKHSIHAPARDILLGALDPEIKRASLKRVTSAFEIGKKTGARWILIHMNFIRDFYEHLEKRWFQSFINSLNTLLKFGIPIHIENGLEDNFIPFKMLFSKDFDFEKISICLDIGHIVAYSNYHPNDWIDELYPWVTEVHLHETIRGHDLHKPLGSNLIDIDSILEHLEHYKKDFIITIEPTTIEHLENDLSWLREKGYLK